MCIRDSSLTLCVYGVEAERRRWTDDHCTYGRRDGTCKFISFRVLCSNIAQNRLKSSNVENFKIPYLPQMGVDSLRIKTVFLRATRAITWTGEFGGVGPVRGRSPNCPKPQILRFFAFSTNFRRNDFRLFLICLSTNSDLSTVEIW